MKKLITLFAAVLMAVGASAETVVDYTKDFKDGSYGMWHSDATDTYTYTPTAGVGFVVENTAAQTNFWDVQYFVASGLTLTAGTEYTITITLDAVEKEGATQGATASTYRIGIGDWTNKDFADTEFTAGKNITITNKFTCDKSAGADKFVLCQSGHFVGTITVKNVKITHESTGTGIDDVKVATANAEFVNAAGQKVGMNYKGLVINKATGKKYINK